MSKLQIISVKKIFFDKCSFEKEILHNDKMRRPYLLLLKLKYKEKEQDFAIPFRSNILGNTNEKEFYALPPNNTTKDGNHHGLHFTKMFPIKKEYKDKFYTSKNIFFQKIIEAKIKKDLKIIVNKAQDYLIDYECGIRYDYYVDIDKILEVI